MANPTRPASGGVIATTWGLAVADTVVRRYPNAATRDTDLAGHTSADLLGQAVVLTDTGAFLVYAGPIMGWRKPWNVPWGEVAFGTSNLAIQGDTTALSVINMSNGTVAGRRISAHSVLNVMDNNGQTGAFFTAGGTTAEKGLVGRTAGEEAAQHNQWAMSVTTTNPTGAYLLRWQGVAGSFLIISAGTLHSLQVTDVGPAANPTALERDGWETLDPETGEPLWVPGLVDKVTHADLLASTFADVADALTELGLGE
jgi:hypothetical protein